MSEFGIREDIKDFIMSLEKKYSIFKYLYNKRDFNPEKDYVYYGGPYWNIDEKISAIEAFISGDWLSAGSNVLEFEQTFTKKFNLKYSTMVNSGSSANLVMLASLKSFFKWNDSDEIIVSPVGFPTTIAPIVQNNLTPVFIDISFSDLNFDVNEIEDKINKKTKAIFISPVLGNPPDMDSLIEIAKKYNLELILDNCDSLGSKWNNKYLSDYCVSSSCSFYPAHHITTGQGGMISTNNSKINKIVRSLSEWGRACTCVGSNNLLSDGACGKRFDKWLPKYDGIVDHKYVFDNMGYNLRPIDLQGAIGFAQLIKFNEIHKLRKLNNRKIQNYFIENIPGISVLKELPKANTSWFGVGIICENQELKESLVSYLELNRIQTRNYFAGNILLHPAYEKLDDANNYPNANKVLKRTFFIGCSPTLTNDMLKYIKDVLSKYK